MPRIPPSLLTQACKLSAHLRVLLPATRDLESAQNELRWIRDYASSSVRPFRGGSTTDRNPSFQGLVEHQVTLLCQQRGRGVPLQYVLGSQPFGYLDIKCERGVLAPRPETEAWVLHLGDMIRRGALSGLSGDSAARGCRLRVVDFCTGSGCIALSLFHSLQKTSRELHVRGIDVSPRAVALSRRNLKVNVQKGVLAVPERGRSISFREASVFDDHAMQQLAAEDGCDVLVSNPPYISRDVWTHGRGQMGHSVRKYEPRLALVPEDGVPSYPGVQHQDVFYWRLLNVARQLGTRAVVFEVGDEEQAVRVASMGLRREDLEGAHIELWRDWPDMIPQTDESVVVAIRIPTGAQRNISIKGSGNIRCVVITRPASPQ